MKHSPLIIVFILLVAFALIENTSQDVGVEETTSPSPDRVVSAQNGISSGQQIKAVRRQFQRSHAEIKSPTAYLNRENSKGEYDPKPRVVLVDQKAGRYELKWIGYDGKEKVVKYQRADAIDAVVEARVEIDTNGTFRYKYLIRNLPGSPNYLSSFTVQTFAPDVQVDKLNDVYIGDMASYLRNFKVGVWWRYAILNQTTPKIDAGKNIEFSLSSKGLPGIVECKATAGELTLKGVGEHMPSELENALPGYEEWASGLTIGPVENLSKLNKSERSKYLSDNLLKFKQAGWITGKSVQIYEEMLKKDDIASVLKKAENDLKDEQVTSEVLAIIKGLNF